MHAYFAPTRALVLAALMVVGTGMLTLSGDSTAQAQEKKERHPHIRAAIKELKEAKKELETAAHDFGGHRKEAIEAVDVAIKQLDKALKADKK